MSDAYECDRCGTLHPDMPAKIVWSHDLREDGKGYEAIEHSYERRAWGECDELCPDCRAAHDEFMAGGSEADDGEAGGGMRFTKRTGDSPWD